MNIARGVQVAQLFGDLRRVGQCLRKRQRTSRQDIGKGPPVRQLLKIRGLWRSAQVILSGGLHRRQHRLVYRKGGVVGTGFALVQHRRLQRFQGFHHALHQVVRLRHRGPRRVDRRSVRFHVLLDIQ